jgi:hypothetical protein
MLNAQPKFNFRGSPIAGACAKIIFLAAVILPVPALTSAQQSSPSLNEVIDRIAAREQAETATIRRYSPIIETYIQDMHADKEFGEIPIKDHYFLGVADFHRGVAVQSLLGKKGNTKRGPFSHFSNFFSNQYDPEGFLQMAFVDAHGLDRANYHFDYVRREFLGELRCLVFDVAPLKSAGKFRFKGRIWADEHDYTIVRFNGVFTPENIGNGFNVHFDSWRTNIQPNLWLPTYIFSQESALKSGLGTVVAFKSQTRLWGYDLMNAAHQSEFSELTVEAPGAEQAQANASNDPSPIEAERQWAREGEDNVIERLERAGFVAPSGSVDKILATVVNNLEVTNNIDIEPEIRCRVLLTGTLESFNIGHTIVVSRGLLDVLPDESSLAAMLAQEVGTILETRRTADPWGFNDLTNLPPTEIVARLSFRLTQAEQDQASKRAAALLQNSPYKDKLNSAGLFLKQLDTEEKALPALINPMLGNRVYLAQQLISTSPQLQPEKLDQISALPLGARIKLDPWSDKVEMLKPNAVALTSVREKVPFEVTPFMPYLTYFAGTQQGPAQAAAPTAAQGGSRPGGTQKHLVMTPAPPPADTDPHN